MRSYTITNRKNYAQQRERERKKWAEGLYWVFMQQVPRSSGVNHYWSGAKRFFFFFKYSLLREKIVLTEGCFFHSRFFSHHVDVGIVIYTAHANAVLIIQLLCDRKSCNLYLLYAFVLLLGVARAFFYWMTFDGSDVIGWMNVRRADKWKFGKKNIE